MKTLFSLLVCLILTQTSFAQSKNQALHIIFQNIDTTYFDESGTRWQEFTLIPTKAFKVNDLLVSDTTLTNCYVVKGGKNYRKYVKENYPGLKMTKMDRKVYGHLDCECDGYLVMMWMYPDYAMGLIGTITDFQDE